MQMAQLKMNVVPASQFWRYLYDYISVSRVAGMDNQIILVVLAHRLTPEKFSTVRHQRLYTDVITSHQLSVPRTSIEAH